MKKNRFAMIKNILRIHDNLTECLTKYDID